MVPRLEYVGAEASAEELEGRAQSQTDWSTARRPRPADRMAQRLAQEPKLA